MPSLQPVASDGLSCCQNTWLVSLQSTSGRPAEPALGHAAHGQSVVGVPSDISHVMHPDGRSTPAMFVEVTADCKVSILVVTQRKLNCIKLNLQ